MPPTEGVVSILLSTTSCTQTTLQRKLMPDSWRIRLQANQVCLSPESNPVSSAPFGTASVTGPGFLVSPSQA